MEVQERLFNEETLEESAALYLTFSADNQLFGLPISDVVQIIQMQEVTPLPEQALYVKGIINLRGDIIPVIDLLLRIGKPEAAQTERTCIIIINVRGSSFGLIVDDVDEVTEIESEQISEPPTMIMGGYSVSNYLTGIARIKDNRQKEQIVLLLHASKILGQDEVEALLELTQA